MKDKTKQYFDRRWEVGGNILYHVVSPVHLRNAQLFAKELRHWNLVIICEENSPWLRADSMSQIANEHVVIGEGEIPTTLWEDAKVIIFSAIQPRPVVVHLLQSAIENDVPSLAIEESNQIALNQGRINNYVLPVDRVLLASPFEREHMIMSGFPEDRFEVTGWPFYTGRVGKIDSNTKAECKRKLGLDPKRPVAALTLTGLNDSGESPEVRRRQLSLAAEGLDDEFQLVVKPHPIEPLDVLMPFINECAPRATVLEGMVRVEELLDAADVLLNRGVSQVCIEALFQEVPVAVIDTGIVTPFHGEVDDVIVRDPGGLNALLAHMLSPGFNLQIYEPFFRRHVPYPPVQAREQTRRYIEKAASATTAPDRDRQWFDLALFQGWIGERRAALNSLNKLDEAGRVDLPVLPCRNLLLYNASWQDKNALVQYVGDGFISHLVRALWVGQLCAHKQKPDNKEIIWLSDFPPIANTSWFVGDIKAWIFLLLHNGYWKLAAEYKQSIHARFMHVPGIAALAAQVDLYLSGIAGRIQLALVEQAKKWLRPIRRTARFVLRRS